MLEIYKSELIIAKKCTRERLWRNYVCLSKRGKLKRTRVCCLSYFLHKTHTASNWMVGLRDAMGGMLLNQTEFTVVTALEGWFSKVIPLLQRALENDSRMKSQVLVI